MEAKRERVVIFGGDFNPPGFHHGMICTLLLKRFSKVIIVPCGYRPEKVITNDINPAFRAAMCDLAFGAEECIDVELFDLENDVYTPSIDLRERFDDGKADIWFVVGAHSLQKDETGKSEIQRKWKNGEVFWSNTQFVVVTEPHVELKEEDLPPKAEVLSCEFNITSSLIRSRAFHHEDFSELVSKRVYNYIKRNGLYRGLSPLRYTRMTCYPRCTYVVSKDTNERVVNMIEKVKNKIENLIAESEADANMVFAIGGDGTMLSAIRKHWRLRVPFFGINVGHTGYLLNDVEDVINLDLFPAEFLLRKIPLLCVTTWDLDGRESQSWAVNDAWIERAGGQTAWYCVKADGLTIYSELKADGILVATAQGSTAYAQAMGATPLLIGAEAVLLVASNVVSPVSARKSAQLPLYTCIDITVISKEKRPGRGFVDGVDVGIVSRMKIKVSSIASAELAFMPHHDIARKLSIMQFPQLKDAPAN